MTPDGIYLRHIIECIDHIEKHTQGVKSRFYTDITAQDAALRKLQLLGESAKRIDEGVKKALPEIEWQKIAGLRNILVHDYLGDINLDIVWAVIQDKLPELKKNLQKYLQKEDL